MPKDKLTKRDKGKQKDLRRISTSERNENDKPVNCKKLFIRLRRPTESIEEGESSNNREIHNKDNDFEQSNETSSVSNKLILRLPRHVTETSSISNKLIIRLPRQVKETSSISNKLIIRLPRVPLRAEAEINTKLGESSKISEDIVPASAEHTSTSNNLTIRLPRDVFEVIAEINRKRPRPRMNDLESSEDEQPTENSNEGMGRFRLDTEESPRRRESQHTNSETIRPENDRPETRREYQRNYQRQRRQAPIVSSWEDTRRKYEKSIKEGPTLVCVCCGGLFFLKNVSLVDKETMLSKWKCESDVVEVAFWAVDNHKFEDLNNVTIMKDGNPEKNYFCSTCKASIKKSRVPTIALKNGFHFPDKVACIDSLTRLEERLVSPRHVFQSIWSHKGLLGQYKTKGGIVNVPVNVDTTVSCLPRNYDYKG